jgi:hypothetical protein
MWSRGLLFLLGCAVLLGACEAPREDREPRYPWPMVRQLLDAEPEEAREALLQYFPGSERVEGSFARYQLMRSEVLDEAILFRDVRSGRVNTVILKYKADLTPADRALALEDFNGPGLIRQMDVSPVVEAIDGPIRLRARAEDKQGRLTLTVEPAPEAPGDLPAP